MKNYLCRLKKQCQKMYTAAIRRLTKRIDSGPINRMELRTMLTVFDVAKYILHAKGPMSTWKLQKLCYYCQAWSLAWTEKQLFPEDFEAWANGPVCRLLYEEHRGMYIISESDIQHGDFRNLTDDDEENINIVLGAYGDKDAYWLREQTHAEDPWKKARDGYADGESCREIISKQSMGYYYGSL